MIQITLTLLGKHIDLLVPDQVTFDRLRRLIADAFAAKGVAVPDGFSLAIDGKALVVAGNDLIASFGVGNGDRFHITTKS